jgi:hypothetical protein
VSKENFDPELSRQLARRNAIAKIWPLEGYLLKQTLSDEQNGKSENMAKNSAPTAKTQRSWPHNCRARAS